MTHRHKIRAKVTENTQSKNTAYESKILVSFKEKEKEISFNYYGKNAESYFFNTFLKLPLISSLGLYAEYSNILPCLSIRRNMGNVLIS